MSNEFITGIRLPPIREVSFCPHLIAAQYLVKLLFPSDPGQASFLVSQRRSQRGRLGVRISKWQSNK